MNAVAELAGDGWRRVVSDVRDLGNDLAHPEPGDLSPVVRDDVLVKLERLDAVLMFTAELERVHVLNRVGQESA
jgi:hypothetical protein